MSDDFVRASPRHPRGHKFTRASRGTRRNECQLLVDGRACGQPQAAHEPPPPRLAKDLRNVDLADVHPAPSWLREREAWWLGWWIGKGGKWWCAAYPRHAHRWWFGAWWCRRPQWDSPANSPTAWVFGLVTVAIILTVFAALEFAEWVGRWGGL